MQGVDALVLRIVQGEPQLWPALQTAIQPTIVAITRSHAQLRKRALAMLEDELADVVAATLERLARDDFKNLRRFAQQPVVGVAGQRSFETWLYGAVEFAVRDHLRKRYGRAPKDDSDRQQVRPSRRDLQSHAGRLEDLAETDRSLLHTLQMTAKLTASEIFSFASAHFQAEEVRALELYYVEQQTFEELAGSLALRDARAAERLIRRLNARLRHRFLDDAESTRIEEDLA
jgi:DNA-directed RNA polymerase specialized sigma24 family protein